MLSLPARADNARFDLSGPKIEVRVTRAGVTLPIASVPNLQAGDRLWLHPALPPTQSVRYLMVLVFLRGTTNPPPEDWFTRVETWDKKVRAEGVEVTVPTEAQQAVLFLAPVTGGDFSTLRSAVQGRPGVFVRAAQDLTAAGFEQSRIETYIASMQKLTPAEEADPKQLQERSNLIATRLALKPSPDCMKLTPDAQYACLTQSGSQTLLDDGHGQSVLSALTTGDEAGLIGTVSTTQLAGGGLYSAYVGSIVDLAHILGSLHTAQYQYIPAIAFPQQQSLNLRLNVPPSFHNPKSVLVIGLPPVQAAVPPPLRAADPNVVSCLAKPDMVLPVEGAPLVFATGFAHGLVLHLNRPPDPRATPDAKTPDAKAAPDTLPQDIPLTADTFRGGLALATQPQRHPLPEEVPSPSAPPTPASSAAGAASAAKLPPGADITGTIEGFWGFDRFTGPTMPLEIRPGTDWRLSGDAAGDWVLAGKDRRIALTATATACTQSIALEAGPASPTATSTAAPSPAPSPANALSWKRGTAPNTVEATLDVPPPAKDNLQFVVRQYGDAKPATVKFVAYSQPTSVKSIDLHAGDRFAELSGDGLDQVQQVEVGKTIYRPLPLDADADSVAPDSLSDGHLRVALAPGAETPKFPVGDRLTARVVLRDGPPLSLPVTVRPVRPLVSLISRTNLPAEGQPHPGLAIRLTSDSDAPVSDTLVFSLRSQQPFPRQDSIELATADGSLHTTLRLNSAPGQLAPDQLILTDPRTLLATVQPLKVFGGSAFGPLRVRAVAADGVPSDWIPLATLVRLPDITGIACPVASPPPQKSDPPPSATTSPASAATTSPAPATPTPAPASTDPPPASPPAAASCTLSGTGLFFIQAIAADIGFKDSTAVPEGFVGSSIAVPPPTGGVYYLKLRDDPATIDVVGLPAGPL